jgi:hypothetical protein
VTTINDAAPVDGKTFNEVAQLSHFGWGALAALAPSAIVGHVNFWSYAIWFGWLVYAAVKEFYCDERYETPAVRGSSLEDFLVQAGGLACGVVALWIAGRL